MSETSNSLQFAFQSKQEVEVLLEGLDSVKRNVMTDSLKRRLKAALRYFKSQETGYEELKAAADKRNAQRRRDGRG